MHNTTKSGAELTIDLLLEQGVDTVFGIPGGANLPLYDALGRSPIRHVLARHEQGAGFMAQGYARSTGRTGVCFATSGPGTTNLVTAIADARMDSVPMVCITGQVPSSLLGTDAFQEVHTFGMTMPITKHNYLVRSAAELAEVIPEAFRIASSGRPGPVLIDVPKDVQAERIRLPAEPSPQRPAPPGQDGPAHEELLAAATRIHGCERPILLVGGGAAHARAGARLRDLAERIDAPIVCTLMGLGVIPSDDPRHLGMLGMHGTLVANRAVAECDLLIVAGARLDDRATGAIETFCPEAQIVHMDIDPAELGKIRRADAALEGDLAATLTLLLPRLESAARPGWQARIDTLREAYGQSAHRNAPARLIREVAEIVGEEAIVSTDVGRHQMWAAQYYPTLGPRRWLTSGGLGTMGFGLPAAIGAAVACPDRTVVCFSGDGSLLMNIQELATAAEEAVNVKIVLFNNQSLGLVRQQQELFYGNRVFASDFRGTVDFGTLARAFGIPSVRIRCGDDHRRTLADVLCSPGPALIEVMTPAETHAHPMVPPGKANTEMILTDIQE